MGLTRPGFEPDPHPHNVHVHSVDCLPHSDWLFEQTGSEINEGSKSKQNIRCNNVGTGIYSARFAQLSAPFGT